LLVNQTAHIADPAPVLRHTDSRLNVDYLTPSAGKGGSWEDRGYEWYAGI